MTTFSRFYRLRRFVNLLIVALLLLHVGVAPAAAEPADWQSKSQPWVKHFGGAGMDKGMVIAQDRAGNILLTGSFTKSTNFGGETLTSAGYEDILLAKYNASGEHLWSKRFGSVGLEYGSLIGVYDDGSFLLSGYFFEGLDLGGGEMVSAHNGDIFLAKFDADGNHIWSKHFGGCWDQYSTSLAVTDDGGIILSGYFQPSECSIDLGGGPISREGGANIFIARYDSFGSYRWSRVFGGKNGSIYPGGLALDPSGNLYMTGHYDTSTSIDLGGGPLTSAGWDDAFLVKYDSEGNHLWSKRLGSMSIDYGYHVIADPSGGVIVSGDFLHGLDLGGGPLKDYGDYTIFLARFDASGNHLWSKSFGSDSAEYGTIAGDADGNIIMTGYVWGTIDFGAGPLANAGGLDMFIVQFNSSGHHLWSKLYGGAGNESGGMAIVDGDGNLLVSGAFDSTIDLGAGPITSNGETDNFLAKIEIEYPIYLPLLGR